jgi:hypothetical protein
MKPLKDLGSKHGKWDNENNQQCSCKIICQLHKCNIYFKFQCQTMMPFVWFMVLIEDIPIAKN